MQSVSGVHVLFNLSRLQVILRSETKQRGLWLKWPLGALAK